MADVGGVGQRAFLVQTLASLVVHLTIEPMFFELHLGNGTCLC